MALLLHEHENNHPDFLKMMNAAMKLKSNEEFIYLFVKDFVKTENSATASFCFFRTNRRILYLRLIFVAFANSEVERCSILQEYQCDFSLFREDFRNEYSPLLKRLSRNPFKMYDNCLFKNAWPYLQKYLTDHTKHEKLYCHHNALQMPPLDSDGIYCRYCGNNIDIEFHSNTTRGIN
jgi:hypothetical protein